MGKGGFFSGFLCAAKLCVAIALAVCAVGGVFVSLGWEGMYLLLLYEFICYIIF